MWGPASHLSLPEIPSLRMRIGGSDSSALIRVISRDSCPSFFPDPGARLTMTFALTPILFNSLRYHLQLISISPRKY